LLVLSFAAPAQAADAVLAPAPDAAAITAYGGHVVLSRRDPSTNKWALVRWHAGVVDVLPVTQRSVPFDADAGPDAEGDPVVVYSRCRRDPAMPTGLAPAADWQTARGCDIYELALTGPARERKLVAASRPDRSETTPSVWRGALAFARHKDGAAVPSIEYIAAGATRSRRLGGGSVQRCEPRCDAFVHDGVEQLDLGRSRVAYLWRMTAGSVYGVGAAWELRAAPLAGGRSTLLDAGSISGACGFRLPSAPTATARIAYLVARSPCEATQTRFASVDPVSGALATATTSGGLAAGAVRDGDTLYWLRVTNPPLVDSVVPGTASCSAANAACELVASSVPKYSPDRTGPRSSPPAFVDLIRSRLGYRWLPGPSATRLLRPPARVPCAPSLAAAYIFLSVQWRHGRHTVRALRTDGNRTRSVLGGPLTRSAPDGVGFQLRLPRCGDRTRVTYVVTTGRSTRRVSFNIVRAPAM
jgi:hypothetical protein